MPFLISCEFLILEKFIFRYNYWFNCVYLDLKGALKVICCKTDIVVKQFLRILQAKAFKLTRL